MPGIDDWLDSELQASGGANKPFKPSSYNPFVSYPESLMENFRGSGRELSQAYSDLGEGHLLRGAWHGGLGALQGVFAPASAATDVITYPASEYSGIPKVGLDIAAAFAAPAAIGKLAGKLGKLGGAAAGGAEAAKAIPSMEEMAAASKGEMPRMGGAGPSTDPMSALTNRVPSPMDYTGAAEMPRMYTPPPQRPARKGRYPLGESIRGGVPRIYGQPVRFRPEEPIPVEPTRQWRGPQSSESGVSGMQSSELATEALKKTWPGTQQLPQGAGGAGQSYESFWRNATPTNAAVEREAAKRAEIAGRGEAARAAVPSMEEIFNELKPARQLTSAELGTAAADKARAEAGKVTHSQGNVNKVIREALAAKGGTRFETIRSKLPGIGTKELYRALETFAEQNPSVVAHRHEKSGNISRMQWGATPAKEGVQTKLITESANAVKNLNAHLTAHGQDVGQYTLEQLKSQITGGLLQGINVKADSADRVVRKLVADGKVEVIDVGGTKYYLFYGDR